MTLRFASESIDTTPCACPACAAEDYGPGKCAYDPAGDLEAQITEIGGLRMLVTGALVHGAGEPIHPARTVVELPGITWRHRPEECFAHPSQTRWLFDDQLLVCTGCGLDCT